MRSPLRLLGFRVLLILTFLLVASSSCFALALRRAGSPVLLAAAAGLLALGTGLFLYLLWRWRHEQTETVLLRDQLEKSALIMRMQQEKSSQIGEKIDSLHSKILMSKQQLESTFDAITDGICVLDEDLVIQRVNRAYSELVNMPIRDLLGRKCFHVFWHSKTPCRNCPTLHTIGSGNIRVRQAMNKTEPDHTSFYEMSSFPIKDHTGKVIHVIESIHDVTEQRQLTEQLIRTEKLSTIGIMTAGIAHEMNNPLSGISGNASNMLQMPDKYGLNEKGVQRVRAMLEASERATRIMRNLLDLSRHHEGEMVFSDLNAIIINALGKIHLPGYGRIVKEFRKADNIPPLRCDPVKMEQVMINIITNAYYAIEDKRESLAATLLPEKAAEYIGRIFVQTQCRAGRIQIQIEDNGNGIPEDRKKHIFDPFFTTRPPGKGTGLGLSISYKIVAEYNGKIWAENSPAGGAQFFIEVPAAKMESAG